MRLDWLLAFRAVMQTGSATSAARIMLRTQPQISRMVASLEKHLGLRLFERDGRRQTPTKEGLEFLQYIEPLLLGLDRVQSTAESIKSKSGKTIVIAAEPFLLHALVPTAIQRLSREREVKCAVDICIRGLGLWMSPSNVDLGIVALPFSQTDMERVAFADADVVAVLPAGHPLGGQNKIAMVDLRDEPFIALRGSTLLRAQIDIAAARAGFALNPRIETTSGVTACEFVARGLGITIADPIVASSFLSAGVQIRPLSKPLQLSYGFLLPSGGSIPEPVQQVMRAVVESAGDLGGVYLKVRRG